MRSSKLRVQALLCAENNIPSQGALSQIAKAKARPTIVDTAGFYDNSQLPT